MRSFFLTALFGAVFSQTIMVKARENSKVRSASANILSKDTTLVPSADNTNHYGFQMCLVVGADLDYTQYKEAI